MVDRSDSVIYADSKYNLEINPYWKNYLFTEYLPKRAQLARYQLTQPFILDIDDFELRSRLMKIVEQIRYGVGDVQAS